MRSYLPSSSSRSSSSRRSCCSFYYSFVLFCLLLPFIRLTLAFSPSVSIVPKQHHHVSARRRLQQQQQWGERLDENKCNTILWSSSSSSTSSSSLSDWNEDEILDVLICGAGPGGLLLASALCQQQQQQNGASSTSRRTLKIGVVDPALHEPWPNNYGIWMDEACHFKYDDCCEAIWKQVGIVFDEVTPECILQRPYGRIDRMKLKSRLLQECTTTKSNGSSLLTMLRAAKAIDVQHYDNKPSVVKLQEKNQKTGKVETTTVHALLVVDATGFARQFVQHGNVPFDPGYQVTYGARFRVNNLGPFTLEKMILMDYSERHLHDDDALVKSNERFPSFCYIMPLATNEIFMEETVLVSRPAASSRDLQARLYKRIKALGIVVQEILEDERAAIPMGGMDPIIPQRTVAFGATSSLVHPASGYMVARAMELAPRLAHAITFKLQALDTTSLELKNGVLDEIAEAGWSAIWPTDERRQRDFMHFGFELLCLLNPQELRDFFTGFFRLPDGLWQHFLSWRLSGIGHVVMGLRVWAQCIPKRFMPAMLWKSLPFVPTRLVFPGLSRGNFARIDTDSLYADARTGNFSLWEPSTYFPYLKELSERDYQQADMSKLESQSQKEAVVVITKVNGNSVESYSQHQAQKKEEDEAREKIEM